MWLLLLAVAGAGAAFVAGGLWLAYDRRNGGRGAGDAVARAARIIGVEPCAPCRERQAAMNRVWPYYQ
jgi:hypothetical protein